MRKSIQDQAQRTRDYSPQPARPAQAPRFQSARSSYPDFLSFQHTAKLQIGWAWRGFVDAFRWDIVIRLMTRNVFFLPYTVSFLPHGNKLFLFCLCSDAEVRANALKSFLLNSISLLSIYVFDFLLHPLSRGEEGEEARLAQSRSGIHRRVGWFYRVLWLLPVVGVSLYLNVRSTINPLRCELAKLHNVFFFALSFRAGLVVFSYCQAHFYSATWSRVSVCWNDVGHVAKRVHRVSELAGYVCVPCRHDCDLRHHFVCAGVCPRCWRGGGNRLLLLG